MQQTLSKISKALPVLFFGFLTFIAVPQSYGQVSIAPTSLFFNSQNPVASLTVSNRGEQTQEIRISTEFGYPTTQNGEVHIVKDSILAEDKSLTSWLKIFPQRFTLNPGQRQIVRFVVQAPSDIKHGGYWSRIQISSNPESAPIEVSNVEDIGAQINLIVNQVIAAHYHTEDANTGVEITSVDYNQHNADSGTIDISMQQTGNAPFIGSMDVEVENDNGEIVYSKSTTNSVYTTITRTFDLDIKDVEPGDYTINVTLNSERRDINSDHLLQIVPVEFNRSITIE